MSGNAAWRYRIIESSGCLADQAPVGSHVQLQTALSALRKIGWYDSGNPTNGWQGELAREILVKLRSAHG